MNKTPHLRFPDTMPYVPVPKDLTKVKTKVVLNLTKRQLVCFSIAAIVGVPAYLVTRGVVGSSAAVFIMIGLMLPFFFFAMYEKDGQPAEKVIRNIVRTRFWPGTRPYKTENLYKYLSEEGKAIDKQDKTTATPSAKKRYAGKKK